MTITNNLQETASESPRLTGFPVVLRFLQIPVSRLDKCGTRQNIYRLMRLAQGATYQTMQALAFELCCTIDDLVKSPSPQRLLEIRAAFLEREAARARAAAQEVVTNYENQTKETVAYTLTPCASGSREKGCPNDSR